jgi:esterase/lipase superfamily enzyme
MLNVNSNNFFLISLRDDPLGNGVRGTDFEKNAVYISSTELVKPEDPIHTYNLKTNSQSKDDWLKAIHNEDYQQVLVFVHGFGNDAAGVVSRHESVKQNVPEDFALVSFDWPSGNSGELAEAYHQADKCNAEKSAPMLMSDCLMLLATEFGPQNVHLFGHSMGAYVTERAFHCPPDGFKPINRVLLAAADVDRSNYAAGSKPLVKFLKCCKDLSVCWSKCDDAMLGSATIIQHNIHRLGGGLRGGFPSRTPRRCTSIECTSYWANIVKRTRPNLTLKE